MTVAPNDIIRVTAVLAGPNGAMENVFQFRANVVLDAVDINVMNDLAEKLDTAYGHISPNMSADVVFVEIQGHNLTQNQPMPTVSWPTRTVGGNSAHVGAAQISFLGLLRTGVRRVLGRKYLGGFPPGAIQLAGFFSVDYIPLVAGFLGEFVGSFIAGSTLNTYLPGLKSKTGAFWGFIEGVASANPATQRRRRQGRGI
jgi:hypothetical protein